ncbi:MAG: hypothetical protein J0L80_07250 [Chitinophagales bacterium]|nr:hypothetical protein [Chitinophagales bacterium]
MAKASKPVKKKQVAKPSDTGNNSDSWYVKVFIVIGDRFGLHGIITFFIMFIFLKFGTDVQKKEFVDRFILLKYENGIQPYPYFIVIIVCIFYIMTLSYYWRKLKIKQQRIVDLEKIINDILNKND